MAPKATKGWVMQIEFHIGPKAQPFVSRHLGKDKQMPQSHAQVWVHIVFSTKDRRTFLKAI